LMPAVLIFSLPVDGHRPQHEKAHSQCASIPQPINRRRLAKYLLPPEGIANSCEHLQHGHARRDYRCPGTGPPVSAGLLQMRVPIDTVRFPILEFAAGLMRQVGVLTCPHARRAKQAAVATGTGERTNAHVRRTRETSAVSNLY
jgi:hypothetical protein